eukprot:TRINITY_DN1578_c0_g1_i1.p1 TRINITY_DN1578_c0_g1~~TRINITY_DN1578_c0_g1_i1.p1  ORF type:complete len:368 (+),score=152.07 TRINITY_DN1578_c0_g1_i1:174-1277(+)
METLKSRTEDLPADKEMVDPVADRRYIIDCAIRTGVQGAPFEEEVIEDSLNYLFESEKEGHVHRWFAFENAQAMMDEIRKNAKESVSKDELLNDKEICEQLAKEGSGKSAEESMDNLKSMLGMSQELCDNITKIRNWLDDGTDMLISEYARDDPVKKAEVIVGLATLSGFLSDYFSIMEVLMNEGDDEEDEENGEDEDDNEREEEESSSKPKKLDPRTFGKKQAKTEAASAPLLDLSNPSTNFFAAATSGDDSKQQQQQQTTFGFGASNAEYDIPEGDDEDDNEEEVEEEGEDELYGDDEFDDEEEMAQLCFTMASIAADDPVFMKTLEVGLSTTSLIMKDFEQWVGVEFVADEQEEEDCPDLVDVQ